jgi:hypothetical protein
MRLSRGNKSVKFVKRVEEPVWNNLSTSVYEGYVDNLEATYIDTKSRVFTNYSATNFIYTQLFCYELYIQRNRIIFFLKMRSRIHDNVLINRVVDIYDAEGHWL